MTPDSQKPNIMPLEKYMVEELKAFPNGGLTGRRKILTSVKEITRDNVLDVLGKALSIHSINASEINYLYGVYCGKQDILDKKKLVRENINNKVVVNRANEIVTFKTAFLLNEPIQYVSHNGNDNISSKVDVLNEMMVAENKAAKDKEIVDWMHICGVAERLTLPDETDNYEGAPFHIDTLHPGEAFCVYNSGIGQKKIGGVILQEDEDGKKVAFFYTPKVMFIIKEWKVVDEIPHTLGMVPLVEYVNNMARQGAFEIVLPLLNSINNLESLAVDSVQDFVNGFDVFQNCDIDDGTYGQLGIGGKAIKIKTVVQGMEAKVYRIFSELNQTGVQTRIDDQTDAYLEICGMPNRNGGLSTSDTGTAVLYRDGWSAAASRAKDTAILFKQAEREFDKLVLKICDTKSSTVSDGGMKLEGLKLSDFDVKFPFGNLQNLQSLAQTFSELLNNDKVHPHEAYTVGAALFKDPESAYRSGMEWYEQNKAEQEESLNMAVQRERENALTSAAESNSTEKNGNGDERTETV